MDDPARRAARLSRSPRFLRVPRESFLVTAPGYRAGLLMELLLKLGGHTGLADSLRDGDQRLPVQRITEPPLETL
jgi:hypothetical protein